jgi:hypothetical protein
MAKSNVLPLAIGAVAVLMFMGGKGDGKATPEGADPGSEAPSEWDEERDAPRVIERLNATEVSLTPATSKSIALQISHALFPSFPVNESAAADYIQSEPGRSIWAGVASTIENASGVSVPEPGKPSTSLGTRELSSAQA